MIRSATLGLVTLIGLSTLSTPAALAQARPTLDAQFPSDHEYVVAVWFKKSDKAGTSPYRIMDQSIPSRSGRRCPPI